jgi:hypothetical protein
MDDRTSLSDAPQCPACGYNLTGLPEEGVCPECGRSYNTRVWAVYTPRPFLGYALLLAIPAAIMVLSFAAFFAMFMGACMVMPLAMLVGAFYAWHAADRVARWHCSKQYGKPGFNPGPYTPEQWIGSNRRFFFIVQLILIFLTWPAFGVGINILRSLGFHVGWS